MAMRRTRVGTYKKCSPPKEVPSVPRDFTYLQVAELGARKLGIEDDFKEGHGSRWCLFHPDGTIIPNDAIKSRLGEKPWTLGEYFHVMKTTQSQMKFGVGLILEVHTVF